MARKRKVESSAAIVDESDKVLYSAFRNSANELSQLYSQAISYNKLSFEAGQRHALGAIVDDLSVLITPVEDYQLPPEALSSKLWAVQGEED